MPDEHKEKSVYERHGRVVVDCVNNRLMCRCPDQASAETICGALMLVAPLPRALIGDPLLHEIVFAAAMMMRGGTHEAAMKYIKELDITDGEHVFTARNDRPEAALERHSDDLAPGRERKEEHDRQEQRYRERRERYEDESR
jgi:hypothetical protein